MVTPSMMSDEESVGERFKVHQPEWRSLDFNAFLAELDCRAVSAKDCPCARVERFQGTPLKCAPPSNIQDWMVQEDDSSLLPESIHFD